MRISDWSSDVCSSDLGVAAIPTGIDGLLEMPGFDDISIVFDATSAGAHHRHDAVLRASGKRIIDLTPAALGPFCIPSVNGLAHLEARSEEHTSELQSLMRISYAVFCLKKQKNSIHTVTNTISTHNRP